MSDFLKHYILGFVCLGWHVRLELWRYHANVEWQAGESLLCSDIVTVICCCIGLYACCCDSFASGHMHSRSRTRAAYSTFLGPATVHKLPGHVVMAMSSLDTLLKGSASLFFWVNEISWLNLQVWKQQLIWSSCLTFDDGFCHSFYLSVV